MGTPVLWALFSVGVIVMVAIDLFAARGRAVTARSATVWTLVWVSVSLLFSYVLYREHGSRAAVPFLTAYVIEYALSVDNLFVFLLVFSYFKVPNPAQHRLLYWGIIGAFVLRGTLIGLGSQLVTRFEWLLYFFGLALLYTAGKLLFGGDDDEVDPEQNRALKVARRLLPVANFDHGLKFFVVENGRGVVTKLFLVLIVVETTDLLFALDSIPAVLGISQDSFIVFTSNACAILGLRSLFFVVSSLMDKFRYLKTGLGVILAFVGVKLMAETYFSEWALAHESIMILSSLGFIALTLFITILASVLIAPPPAAANTLADTKPEQPHV